MSDDLKGNKPAEDQALIDAVTKEIEKLGDNTKHNFEELNNLYKKLTERVDTIQDQQDRNTAEKIATDISVRQEKMEKDSAKMHEKLVAKIEEIEAALKRPSNGMSPEQEAERQKMYEEFKTHCLSATDRKVSEQTLENFEFPIEMYDTYCKAVVKLFRYGVQDFKFSPDEQKALSEGVDPHGGYTVTPAMSNRIITKIYESDPIRQLASVQAITTAELEFMVDVDEASCGWEGETETGAETGTPDLGMKKIQVFTMFAKPHATRNLIEDSGINIETWLANKVAEKFARTEAAAFLTGDGIGKPRGMLTYTNGTTHKTIEQISMGNASLLTADGFIKVKYGMVEDYLDRGTWLMNRTTVRDAMLLKYGDGHYIWKPALIASDPMSTILGSPVRMSTTMPAVAANALSVIYADFAAAYQIVDRLGITVERDPYTVKPFIEYYTRRRVGGGLINGQAIKIGKISA